MKESLDPKSWWERALHDRAGAHLCFAHEGEDLSDLVCYLCHQACEKMLKAYLLSTGWTLERTHDLRKLAREAAKSLPVVESILPALSELDVDFAPSRYPFEAGADFDREEAKQSLSTMEALYLLLRKQLTGK